MVAVVQGHLVQQPQLELELVRDVVGDVHLGVVVAEVVAVAERLEGHIGKPRKILTVLR